MAEHIENQYLPEVVSPPGETLQETLEAIGMSQAELAERTGRPKKTINEIVNGKAAITYETALQFERVVGVPASFWNTRELQYREYLSRRDDSEQLSQWQQWLRRFPVSLMTKRGWLKKCVGKPAQVRELLTFFGIAGPDQWERACLGAAAYRKSQKSRREPLSVWLRRGQIVGQGIDCAPFGAEKFKSVLSEARSWTRLDPVEFVPKLREACASAGVAVAFVPELPGSGVSGATLWLSQTKALLLLSLRYKSNDQLWFTFFHEAGHLLLHGKTMFLEGFGGEHQVQELEADRFAANHLIPASLFARFVQNNRPRFSAAVVDAFATQVGIAPGIVVGRLQHDRLLPFNHLQDLKTRYSWQTEG